MQTYLPYPNFDESIACLDDLTLELQAEDVEIICANIFPVHIKFDCESCWDMGGIPFCQTCKKRYKACKCPTCKDKGMIPKCTNCQRKPGPLKASENWYSHPAVLMWRPYRWALLCYSFAVRKELILRDLDQTLLDKLEQYGKELSFVSLPRRLHPIWLGNHDLHASHRSHLLRTDPKWYGEYGWKEPNNLPLIWPR